MSKKSQVDGMKAFVLIVARYFHTSNIVLVELIQPYCNSLEKALIPTSKRLEKY